MYPIKFKNIYYEKIWGGRDLAQFRDNLPLGDIGESWDVACHSNGMSIVENGELKGKRFDELIKEYGKDLLGESFENKDFPLLVKLINSREKLSVQVHPNDEYANRVENSLGKTEAWYVVDAKPGACLIVGTKDCSKAVFEKAIKEGKTEDYLNKIQVKKGDCFLINSGLVHAICEGVIIAEIQQNSDITYRIYDYGRPREIHVDKSLDVIDFGLKAMNFSENKLNSYDGYKKGVLCSSEYFTMEKYVVNGEVEESSDINKFFIFTCVDGNGFIKSLHGHDIEVLKGDSILIPAKLGKYVIEGNLTLLKSYI
ncbi:type I phosphomannose isomerase catalytic subunit [Clostridium botulinum]|uniref:Phosphohexomutase n=1 Tax=Clostridium botulinum TaxID=1491 RepID=A0A6M0SNI5_CLOBO|nr:type I phosphomannose isomerase catalytic subunit [Clostridium botulinum]MBY6810208.1 mannose-6-phosphate isomerase [Clostridium botulinum]MBY6823436.1 mannose-6-phosphate isomerase [Clostridium botulinum]MBY6834068.1 mannose-6-phosphate isomerase [Clostridium botulinum]MBY6972415.1 mannose-6-phosphate isomerase [Clostridium botulinum]MCS6104489.1 mannose-6-phosphate isomerase [Clostridium botulinum]